MEIFIHHKGKVALLDRANVNTDQIIPKQFLTKIGKTGFGECAFYDWRYLDDGSINPEFILNKKENKNASILLVGENFGCGSSREHAVWALKEYGFKSIIATSFADIFYNNCLKNALLPITIDVTTYQKFKKNILQGTLDLNIDLPNQIITLLQSDDISFTIDPFGKEFLVKGMDSIDWSLQFKKSIKQFEENQKVTRPWLWYKKL